jgi:hypothetical protein
VPWDCQVDGYNLGRWTTRQRTSTVTARSTPTGSRAGLGVGHPPDASWREGLNELRCYVKHYGDARVRTGRSWTAFGSEGGCEPHPLCNGPARSSRRAELDRLPGWVWKARDDQWENNISRRGDYARRHGRARVPVSYADERGNLGSWMHNQRCQHNSGELDPGRDRRLQDLPGWTWNCITDAR